MKKYVSGIVFDDATCSYWRAMERFQGHTCVEEIMYFVDALGRNRKVWVHAVRRQDRSDPRRWGRFSEQLFRCDERYAVGWFERTGIPVPDELVPHAVADERD